MIEKVLIGYKRSHVTKHSTPIDSQRRYMTKTTDIIGSISAL